MPDVPLTDHRCCVHEALIASVRDDDDRPYNLCYARLEVTVSDYKACVAAGACTTDGLTCGAAANWGRVDREDHPINCVSAAQAEVYCAWAWARLPSFQEWTAVATNRRVDSFPWGGDSPDKRICWSYEERRSSTCKAGQFSLGATHEGISDLVGNVAEWTSTTRKSARVFAGGAWNDRKTKSVSGDSMNWNDPMSQFDDVGFRCVRSSR